MSQQTSSPQSSVSLTDLPIETMRAIAILLLVSFHVIGGNTADGLGLSYPHPLRYFADLLVNIRMPFFAFVAGAVYALRPVEPSQLGKFQIGKLRRLAIPGLTAITIFILFTWLTGGGLPFDGEFWQAYYRGYAIFWFLQAMLLFFLIFGTADILTRGQILLPALLVAFAALGSGSTFETDILAANRISFLFAYLLLGIAYVRYHHVFRAYRGPVLALAALALLMGLGMTLNILLESDALPRSHLGLRSLLLASGSCLLTFMLLPHLRSLDWLGGFSLTIYLYHILATSATRRVLDTAGTDSLILHVLLGTLAGVAAPLILHLVMSQWSLTRLLFLGLKPRAHQPRRRVAVTALPVHAAMQRID
ncbi:acyltransferase family protein [Paracoccus sp. (in: a-proteobacteria)]|uniref:acyltransferase family protein n=1 Tax=Paracoccus sp. TaxID=267 RepID=UPI00396C7BDE